jgi:hypothetical protein
MTQRVHAELADRRHEVSVELALSDEVMRDGVRRYDPDPDRLAGRPDRRGAGQAARG